jgi:hypothetical protein
MKKDKSSRGMFYNPVIGYIRRGPCGEERSMGAGYLFVVSEERVIGREGRDRKANRKVRWERR